MFSSRVITELTPELEFVVTVDGRPFTAVDKGVEQVGGWNREKICNFQKAIFRFYNTLSAVLKMQKDFFERLCFKEVLQGQAPH